MESRIDEQLRSLLIALIAGGGVGLLYDLMAVGRIRTGRFRLLAGALFLLTAFLWLWVTSMASGRGTDLTYLCAAAGGVCLYDALIHRSLSPLITKNLSRKNQKPGKKAANRKNDAGF